MAIETLRTIILYLMRQADVAGEFDERSNVLNLQGHDKDIRGPKGHLCEPFIDIP